MPPERVGLHCRVVGLGTRLVFRLKIEGPAALPVLHRHVDGTKCMLNVANPSFIPTRHALHLKSYASTCVAARTCPFTLETPCVGTTRSFATPWNMASTPLFSIAVASPPVGRKSASTPVVGTGVVGRRIQLRKKWDSQGSCLPTPAARPVLLPRCLQKSRTTLPVPQPLHLG